VRAPAPSRVPQRVMERPDPQPPCPNTRFILKVLAAALKPRWNWRGLLLSGSLPPRCARIAITPDTVRPGHGAAIVEGERDESSAPDHHARSHSLVPVPARSAPRWGTMPSAWSPAPRAPHVVNPSSRNPRIDLPVRRYYACYFSQLFQRRMASP